MTRKMLYLIEREGGGQTVSREKPEGSYKVRWRLIADEGKGITDGIRIVRVIDVSSRKECEAWQECDLPEEEDAEKFMKQELKRARAEAEAMEAQMMDKALEGLDIPEGIVFVDTEEDDSGTDEESSPAEEDESDGN